MKFFILFLEIPDYGAVEQELLQFKKNLQQGANITVIDVEESNYDFIYNSLIEQSQRGTVSGIDI